MKKLRGSVSLFAATVFLLVASVITATIRSARIHGAKVMVRTASSMALDSVFAEYDSQLFSEFGILLFDGKQGQKEVSKETLAGKLWNYMQYNLDSHKDLYFSGSSDLYGITGNGVSVDRLIAATEHGGLLWQDMAVDYEKYAKPVNLAAEYLGFEETNKEAKAVQEISDKIVECTEQILKINNKVRMLVGLVDGVKCPETGIDYSEIETEESFIKKFCPVEPTYDNLRINQPLLSSIISGKVVDPLSNLDRAEKYIQTGQTKEAEDELYLISGLAGECLRRIDNTDMLGKFVGADMETLKEGIEEADELISGNSEYLSDDVMEGLAEEITQIEQYREVMAEEVCDVEKINGAVMRNRAVLERIIHEISEINVNGDSEKVQGQLMKLREIIKSYSFEGLEFNYSSLGVSSEDTSILDALSDFLENGLLSIVLPDGKSVSSVSVPRLPDSASNVCGKTKDTSMLTAGGDSASLLAKNIIYTEYVMDNFASFMDDGGTVINYEVEYIICGENTDKKNLTETVMRIAALRSGVNMVYLLTDSDKKSDAYTLAVSMAGATALEPVIRLLQYTIMYVWAFAEGLSDVRILFAGEKIEIMKTEDTWNLSFDKLLSHDFSSNSDSKNKNGLDYEMFLRILLYLESDSIKAAYTMDLVEFYMIVNHDKKFRLKDYVYGMEISTSYRLKGMRDGYTEKSVYTY